MSSDSSQLDAQSTDQALQGLLDHKAVCEVVMEYARGIDRGDIELVRSCYHPDAFDDHGPFRGTLDEFIPYVEETTALLDFSNHFIMNQLVDLDGDTAWVESYCLAVHRLLPTDQFPLCDWTVNVRYYDRMERREGKWKIADRRVLWDGIRFDPVGNFPQTTVIGILGRRDRTDLSYDRH